MGRLKGITMIVFGAMLWGATGPMMEWILANSQLSIPFMLITRLLLAGVFVLVSLKLKGIKVMLPLQQKVWLRQMIIFGMFGMMAVQYSFLASISTSNAVIATLFQFLAPIYVIAFVSWKQKASPPGAQVLGMFVTIVGLFLLLTNGSLTGFSLTKEAIIWGILVGFSFAFYTLYPARLMAEWGVLLVVGWGMLIGGSILLIINPMTFITELHYLLDWKISMMLLLVIIIGTLAFVLFLGSMKYITAVETSVLSSFEPLTAMIISALWFGQMLGNWQLTGAIIMLIGVVWLSIAGSRARI